MSAHLWQRQTDSAGGLFPGTAEDLGPLPTAAQQELPAKQLERDQLRRAEQAAAKGREAQRRAELELIARAKAVDAERKHQADLAWAIEVLAGEGIVQKGLLRDRIATSVRHAVWQRDAGKCTECGSRENLGFDHIIPLADGGANTERNLQLLCEPCNRRKGQIPRLGVALRAAGDARGGALGAQRQ